MQSFTSFFFPPFRLLMTRSLPSDAFNTVVVFLCSESIMYIFRNSKFTPCSNRDSMALASHSNCECFTHCQLLSTFFRVAYTRDYRPRFCYGVCCMAVGAASRFCQSLHSPFVELGATVAGARRRAASVPCPDVQHRLLAAKTVRSVWTIQHVLTTHTANTIRTRGCPER